MKILYITPRINDEGGVARVLSVKTNYQVRNLDYNVHILTQNLGNNSLFYDFDFKIMHHDMLLSGNKFQYFLQYKKQLNFYVKQINPNIIIVADNGLKGFLVPILLKTQIPIIFECHGSKFVSESEITSKIMFKSIVFFKSFLAKKFKKFITLSDESKSEWKQNNLQIIPNPNWFSSNNKIFLANRKAIVVARHSYEKGVDRIIYIWQKVIQNQPNWILDIYGKGVLLEQHKKLAKQLGIENSINFYEPTKNIQEKYEEASIYLMTSITEGFPMVLLEAMSCGLPCVAYDCPVGPRAIITNNETGFLIPDNDIDLFVDKILKLVQNQELRITIGENAKKSVQKYNIDMIMNQWNDLFLSLKKN
jgi:glycosyltransferase involved in cell wall biosynthesis